MNDLAALLHTAADRVAAYRESLADRPVRAAADVEQVRAALGGPLPRSSTPPGRVVDQLVSAVEPGLVATAGPRFFGFVMGGALPASTAADVLAVGWDQCAFNAVLSPAASAAEGVSADWLKQLLGLPSSASVGFVTGA